jgi:hypothetical protein
MSRSYTSSPLSASVARSSTDLLLYTARRRKELLILTTIDGIGPTANNVGSKRHNNAVY